MTTPTISDAQIREAAYFSWLNAGCPDGQADAHWHAASAALDTPAPKKRRAAKPKSTASKTAAPKKAAKPRARKAAAKDS